MIKNAVAKCVACSKLTDNKREVYIHDHHIEDEQKNDVDEMIKRAHIQPRPLIEFKTVLLVVVAIGLFVLVRARGYL